MMESLDPVVYVCAACGGEFVSERSDEEAADEATQVFGVPLEDYDVVCDVCWKSLLGHSVQNN